MNRLENAILEYCKTSTISQFQKSILNNVRLTAQENEVLYKILSVATDFDNWNNQDLVLGCKITQKKLKESFDLSDTSIAIIVKIASYDWK
jgi:hypothetical protein